jgi:hypothetical protein
LAGTPASAAPSILNKGYTITAEVEIPEGGAEGMIVTEGGGKHTIVFSFKPDGSGLGKGGTGVLSVDGQEVAKNTLDHTTPITFPEDESFDVGLDTRTGVALLEYRYDVPFKFTGKIDKLTFKLEPEQRAEANP